MGGGFVFSRRETADSATAEIKTLEKALEAYKNGKTPAQPKPEGQDNGRDAAKPAAQTSANNNAQ